MTASRSGRASSANQQRRIPPPSPDSVIPSGDASDEVEDRKFGDQDFSLRKQASDFKRQEITRDLLSWGMVVVLLLSFIAIASMIVVLAWHYVVSSAFHWLSDEQLGDMKSLLFSGAVAGAVAAFVQRHTS